MFKGVIAIRTGFKPSLFFQNCLTKESCIKPFFQVQNKLGCLENVVKIILTGSSPEFFISVAIKS